MAAISLGAWHDEGTRVPVTTRTGGTRELFVHRGASGEHVTLLHGFPSSSWDFVDLVDRFEGIEHLAVDLLGFGASEKPAGYRYSLFEQVDLIGEVLSRSEVERTHLLAHDYSVSIVQEILAQAREGAWSGPEIASVTLLNGGLFYSAIDRNLIQDVLRTPVIGPLVARVMPAWRFRASFRAVFSDAHLPSREALDQHWEAITMNGGRGAIAHVARYLDERKAHEARWTRALADAPVPVRYIWGLEDPISGPTILAALREWVKAPDVVELEDVGHYPQIETPERVHAALPFTVA